MKRNYLSTAVLAAIVMLSGSAIAAGDPPKASASDSPAKASRPAPSADRNPVDRTADTGALTFKALDANKDGHISKDEAKASSELNKQFAELDKDRDGKLSAQEMKDWKGHASATANAGRAEPQTAGRSKLPAAPRQSVPGSTEGPSAAR